LPHCLLPLPCLLFHLHCADVLTLHPAFSSH
jgi:hypothetical protein